MSSLQKVLFFLTFFTFATRYSFAQEQDKKTSQDYLQQALDIMEATSALDDARDILILAANFDTTNVVANFRAGDAHLQTINKDFAVKFFLRVYRQAPNYRFDLEYFIGKSYQYGMEYDKAIDFYNRYKDKFLKKPNYQGKDKIDIRDVDRRIQECRNGKDLVANPRAYSITNIGREINSEFDDYAPVLNPNEDEIIFTTRRRDGNTYENVADDNKPYEDIFISKKSGGSWSSAKNIGPIINTKTSESDLALSPDGNTLFTYRDEGNGDIYFSKRQKDGTFGPLEPLPGLINSSYRETSVSITADGNYLFFASERPGGLGGSDIYVCSKDSKAQWSKVRNLGPSINTQFDEDGPFIDYDGKTLYFSSEGINKGMGGFDIYKSTWTNIDRMEWSDPENLGYPINSPDDDIYFTVSKDGKRWYYASVKDEGLGYLDIYIITPAPENKEAAKKEPEKPKEEPKKEVAIEEPKKEEPKVTEPPKEEPKKEVIAKEEPKKEEPKKEVVKEVPKKEPPVKKEEPKKPAIQPLQYVVSIVDADTGSPIDAKVKLQGLKDNVVVGTVNQGNGIYQFNITSTKPKDYRLSVEHEGYIFINQNIRVEGATDQSKTVKNTITLRKLVVGAVSILRNIYFDFDKATFKTESYSELNKLEAMMRQNSNLQVEISGHTDSFGSSQINKALSLRRANAVKSFLTSKGIDTRRIKTVGHGEDRPLASNDDELEGRQYNRRVEFRVLGN